MSHSTIIAVNEGLKQYMKTNIGTTFWHYPGIPQKGQRYFDTSPYETEIVDVFEFQWEKLPSKIQELLVKLYALKHNISVVTAGQVISKEVFALPCDEVKVRIKK